MIHSYCELFFTQIMSSLPAEIINSYRSITDTASSRTYDIRNKPNSNAPALIIIYTFYSISFDATLVKINKHCLLNKGMDKSSLQKGFKTCHCNISKHSPIKCTENKNPARFCVCRESNCMYDFLANFF